MDAISEARPAPRWELYKLLGEPLRLRLLALCAEEELAIGELAELLGEGQPNVSRHLKHLRRAGLVTVRKNGTRVLAHLADDSSGDPVVVDALASGQELCRADGSLAKVAEVVRARDAASRAFFEQPSTTAPQELPSELPAYLTALAPLIDPRRFAIDAGTGDGAFLEAIAPIFQRVLAVDRSEAQLARAADRLARRGYDHVTLLRADVDDPQVHERADEAGGADVVFASRLLHHAPRPGQAFAALASLLAPGGAVVVLDYVAHQDEAFREKQADTWLGFDGAELRRLAKRAGLSAPSVVRIPSQRCGEGPDGHLDWQVLVARRARA